MRGDLLASKGQHPQARDAYQGCLRELKRRSRAAKEDEEREQQAAAQKIWEEKKTGQAKDQVNHKIHRYLSRAAQDAKEGFESDWRDQQLLKQSKERIDKELKSLQETKKQLEQHIATVDQKTQEITEWLEESKNAKEESKASNATKEYAAVEDDNNDSYTMMWCKGPPTMESLLNDLKLIMMCSGPEKA